MPNETMPKPPYLGPRTVLGLCSPLLMLAEIEAESKAKAPRLRAQQVRVAKGKKGRLRAALRHLWDKVSPFGVCRPRLRPHNSSAADSGTLAWIEKRECESSGTVLQMPPEEKKG
jgi:hypothetical protein